jgi:hypothetical protein
LKNLLALPGHPGYFSGRKDSYERIIHLQEDT